MRHEPLASETSQRQTVSSHFSSLVVSPLWLPEVSVAPALSLSRGEGWGRETTDISGYRTDSCPSEREPALRRLENSFKRSFNYEIYHKHSEKTYKWSIQKLSVLSAIGYLWKKRSHLLVLFTQIACPDDANLNNTKPKWRLSCTFYLLSGNHLNFLVSSLKLQ